MHLQNPNAPDPADDLLPLLDEALSELSPPDREVLLMRFFSKKSFALLAAIRNNHV